MASSLIHLCVANEVNKKIKKNKRLFLIGSIAPDLAKIVGTSRDESHFIDNELPQLDKFLAKYRNYLDDDFVLGYYVHLVTDYLWTKYFISDFVKNDILYKIDGTKVKIDENTLFEYIYSDYTNLNIQLIDKYNLDLKIFYEQLPVFENIIDEIDMDKLDKLMEKAGIILENTKVEKTYIFNIDIASKFIEMAVFYILDDLHVLTG